MKSFPMMLHTEIINYVAEKIKAETYLEIGVYSPDHNFNRVKVSNKIGVDPDPAAQATVQLTSDEFFKGFTGTYDIIFVDGLHHADQVRKDIINSWDCLRDGGVLILHDTNPHSEHITHVPRDSREWTGDVYKAVYQVKNHMVTFEGDYGVTLIRKEGPLQLSDEQITWEEFDLFRREILNLKDWNQTLKIINTWQTQTTPA
jgi:SAM-dependent methyltransferase